MRGENATDRQIAELAGAQHGVLSRRQLLALGLSDDAIDRRIAAGRLHRLHRGVFAVGHRVLRIEGRWMAAVLAGGANAVLSHASAAAAWELRPIGSGAIHVTIPSGTGRMRRARIRVHRSRTLTRHDTTVHRGIPITTPLRTIIDIAPTLAQRPLEQVLNRAEQLRLIDFADLQQARSPSSQAVLSRYTAGTTPTRSELEERFLQLCEDHDLPRPETNTRINGIEVDFVWRDAKLIVEVDGYAHHRSPTAFERDRERDVVLTVAGWRVMRFTHAQVTRRPGWVAAAIG
jgi:very-short-patch-repair endonuclease/predicted transcriptional regulator of viral defense system